MSAPVPVPGLYREPVPDGTITDPLTYHRIRVNEALGFGGALDASWNLDGLIAEMEAIGPRDHVAICTLRRIRNQILAVRDLCADGDRASG